MTPGLRIGRRSRGRFFCMAIVTIGLVPGGMITGWKTGELAFFIRGLVFCVAIVTIGLVPWTTAALGVATMNLVPGLVGLFFCTAIVSIAGIPPELYGGDVRIGGLRRGLGF